MKQYIYMMRHGQTRFNQLKKIQGSCDSRLTEYGIQQAQVARDNFREKGIQFNVVYASPQERACDTADIVVDFDLEIHRIQGLREWDFGRFEGESEALNPPLPYADFFVRYGGESETEVRERLNQTMYRIMEDEHNKHILVVSHGAATIQFMRSVVPKNQWKWKRAGFH